MNNVIRLFARRNADIAFSETGAQTSNAMTSIMASSALLGRTVKELSEQFDAVENAIEAMDDTETRNRLMQSIKLSRETMWKAMLKLSQQIALFANCLDA